MREILFKAKRMDNGEWVEGYFFLDPRTDKGHIIYYIDGIMYNYIVEKETLCQYTDKRDKNDIKIWENDILNGDSYPFLNNGVHNYFAEVTWFDNCSAFGIYVVKNPLSNVNGIAEGNTELMEEWDSSEWEVIGNIFDNPDLLERELS